jgi:hypothetical protein
MENVLDAVAELPITVYINVPMVVASLISIGSGKYTNSDFAVATNGAITVANLLSQLTYDLEIQASDNAAPPLSSVAYVYISVASDPVFTNLPLPMDMLRKLYVICPFTPISLSTQSKV